MSSYDVSSNSLSSRRSSIQSDRQQTRQHEHAYLRPEDAIYASSPPRKEQHRKTSPPGRRDTVTAATSLSETNRRREKRRGRSASRRRKQKGTWKKLLWVKQSYPDNYTDEETFLDHLQRNPQLRPYEFWPLVADSTIIVQHVCSVVIFVSCFTAIFQERVSPQTVVSWATTGTVLGWILKDFWQTAEEDAQEAARTRNSRQGDAAAGEEEGRTSTESAATSTEFGTSSRDLSASAISAAGGGLSRTHSRSPSATSLGITPNAAAILNSDTSGVPLTTATTAHAGYVPPYDKSSLPFSPRMQERFATVKSAILIYCSLLGLSPILKSLTMSTSSDSIWALSSWLMVLNVFTFDYGAGPESKFPASLSTNAALMASTVLASRLPTTTHVFSLTLFSIEVFGLFPVFRRHLRHHSWVGHLWLTAFLVILASGGLSMTISGRGWGIGIVGVFLGVIITCLSMGMTSWWLIGLQRYKNEIHGPWDPARPIIRRHWD